MTKQEIDALAKAKKANPEAGRRSLAKLTGVTVNKVQAWLEGRATVTPARLHEIKSPVTAPMPKGGRSLSEFRNTYDKSTIVPAKIKAALKALGAQGWEYEVQFVRMAGISPSDLGNFRDMFADHIVALKDRRAWAGSTKTATAMKEML
jgi:hypothetical protein